MEVHVVDYDDSWPADFEAEAARLRVALESWLSGGIQHVGSTSVPGLAAKPIIDMIAGVADLEESKAAIDALALLGYTHAPHRPRALWFHKRSEPDWRTDSFNLHLTEVGSDLWVERLAFRDALRRSPALLVEYANLKRELASAHQDDAAAYTAGKRDLVRRVLDGVGVELLDWRSSILVSRDKD